MLWLNCCNRLMSLVSICSTGFRIASMTEDSKVVFCRTMSNSIFPGRKVLSIQSHVVHGYVGNKSATFPLQVLGFEVDAINSVQFSNHTGYKHIKGQILNDSDLMDVFDGLCLNQLLGNYSHLLTGYIGNSAFLRQIATIVKKMKETNPNLIYVCDPVMGDNGQMYVPKELLPIYRDEIIPLADIITPNQYEVELITGHKIQDQKDVWAVMKWFHDKNVKTVALSSTELGADGELMAFLSQSNGTRCTLKIPKQGNGIDFTGTGDLFAALFLAHSHLNKDISNALEYTIASLQAVIKTTINSMPDDVKTGKRKVTSQERELKLIQSKRDIEQPNVILKANLV